MPKILIGLVTYGKMEYCLNHVLGQLRKQTIPVDILFVVNNGESAYASLIKSKVQDAENIKVVEDPLPASSRIEKIVNGRNYVRTYALDNGYDYIFFVDSDIAIPADATEILLEANADVTSGVYLNALQVGEKTVIAPVLYRDMGNGEAQLYTKQGVWAAQILDIGAAGFGCTLVVRKVLEKISIKTDKKNATGGEDIAFYVEARKKGFRCVAHTGVKCLHMHYPITDPRAKLFDWRTVQEEK